MPYIPYHAHKDPGEIKDYSVDFSGDLATGDSVSSVAWTVPSGLTHDENNDTLSGAIATLKVGGGTHKKSYLVVAVATTAQSMTLTAAFWVPVWNKFERE